MTTVCVLCVHMIQPEKVCIRFTFDDSMCVCQKCEADARLGRLVQGMAPGGKLKHLIPGGWHCMNRFGQQDAGATPEEALERAGVREVER